MSSKVGLVSNAMILIGDLPINNLDGNDRRQQIANNLYDGIKKAELSKFRWSFAQKKIQLGELVDAPVDEWNTAYQLPTDILKIHKIKPNVPYEIYGDKLYCNITGALYMDYTANVSESLFSADFDKLMEYALAKDFAIPIKQSKSLKAEMKDEYKDQAAIAKVEDSKQRPQHEPQDSPFIDIRN